MRSQRAKRAELADQLHSAAIHLLRQLRKEDDASGLSAPRLSALSVVVFGGPVTLGQLARAEQVRPPTMTKIVTGLEKDGLVERKPDSHDGRVTRIIATAKGQRILVEGRARRVKSLTQAVEGLSDAELAQLDRGIKVFQKLISATRRQPSEENAAT